MTFWQRYARIMDRDGGPAVFFGLALWAAWDHLHTQMLVAWFLGLLYQFLRSGFHFTSSGDEK